MTSAVVVPIEVTKNNNTSNLIVTSNTGSKQNPSNINQSKIITNENLNINSILLSDIPENKIDNMMNNYFNSKSSNKNNAMFIQTSNIHHSNYNKDKIIIHKARQIVNELYTKKLSLTSLIEKNKYISLHLCIPPGGIPKGYKVIWVTSPHWGYEPHPEIVPWTYGLSNQDKVDIIQQKCQSAVNTLSKLKGYAIGLTTIATITSAVAVAEASTGDEIGALFTAVAAGTDWNAVYWAWKTYNNGVTPLQNCIAEIATIYSGAFTAHDLWVLKDKLPDDITKIKDCLSSLNGALSGAEIANGFDIVADPENIETESTLNVIVSTTCDILNPILDSLSTVLGALDVNWTQN